MKLLSKINRGVILTFVVVLSVIIYLVSNSIYNSTQKPILEDISKEYMEVYLEYEMLPQENRVKTPQISSQELDAYIDEMIDVLSEYYPDDENYYKFAMQNKIGNLTSQNMGSGVIVDYSKSIISFDEFIFTGNMVDIKIKTFTTIEHYDLYNPIAEQIVKTSQETTDQIIFQKINGEWKVVYSNISRPFTDGPGRMY